MGVLYIPFYFLHIWIFITKLKCVNSVFDSNFQPDTAHSLFIIYHLQFKITLNTKHAHITHIHRANMTISRLMYAILWYNIYFVCRENDLQFWAFFLSFWCNTHIRDITLNWKKVCPFSGSLWTMKMFSYHLSNENVRQNKILLFFCIGSFIIIL